MKKDDNNFFLSRSHSSLILEWVELSWVDYMKEECWFFLNAGIIMWFFLLIFIERLLAFCCKFLFLLCCCLLACAVKYGFAVYSHKNAFYDFYVLLRWWSIEGDREKSRMNKWAKVGLLQWFLLFLSILGIFLQKSDRLVYKLLFPRWIG